MRRATPSPLLFQAAIAACAIGFATAAVGCADGSAPTSASSATGSGGGGAASGSGGGGDDTGGTTTSGSSQLTSSTTSGSSGDGGGTGEGGAVGEGGSGEGGSGEGGSGEGGGGECGVECPEGFWDVDNNPLTGECGCEYACESDGTGDDPIDEDFTDSNCDGGDGVVESCVYVSASLGVDSNGGTRSAPMQTIAAAITHAVANGVPAVCLSGEDYFENVAVASGVSIYGGFDAADADFAFRRKAEATSRVVAEGTVFYADNIAQDTHIEGLRIEATMPAAPGSSVYGVRLRTGVGRLYVRYNDLQIADAQDGVPGADGTPPPAATALKGEDGTDGHENDDPAGGTGGDPAACAEPGGRGGDAGYSSNSPGEAGDPGSGNNLGGELGAGVGPCANGDGGEKGEDGDNGVPGSTGGGGQSIGRIDVAVATYVPSAGIGGGNGTNGKGGGGGGGGGGGPHRQASTDFPWCVRDRGGGGGAGGCGGLAGKLGGGGGGGGGSFGVFASGGKLTVTDNDILTGFGGDGAPGGDGGNRQLGGSASSGGNSADGSSSSGGNGGPGSKGGDGGHGGPGGGGGGGPSICVAHASSTQLEYDDNSCSTAGAGAGGLGGTNPASTQGGPGATGTVGFNVTINTL